MVDGRGNSIRRRCHSWGFECEGLVYLLWSDSYFFCSTNFKCYYLSLLQRSIFFSPSQLLCSKLLLTSRTYRASVKKLRVWCILKDGQRPLSGKWANWTAIFVNPNECTRCLFVCFYVLFVKLEYLEWASNHFPHKFHWAEHSWKTSRFRMGQLYAKMQRYQSTSIIDIEMRVSILIHTHSMGIASFLKRDRRPVSHWWRLRPWSIIVSDTGVPHGTKC